jgi:hypothetical protein
MVFAVVIRFGQRAAFLRVTERLTELENWPTEALFTRHLIMKQFG